MRIGISKLLSGRDDLHLDVSLEDSRTFSLNVNVEAVGIYHQHLVWLVWILPPLLSASLHDLRASPKLQGASLLMSKWSQCWELVILAVPHTMIDRLVYTCPPSSPL